MTRILAATAIALALSASAHAQDGLGCNFEVQYYATDTNDWKAVGSPTIDGVVFEFLPGNKIAHYRVATNGKAVDDDRAWIMDVQTTNERYAIDGKSTYTNADTGYTINRQTGVATGYLTDKISHYAFSYKGTCKAETLSPPKI